MKFKRIARVLICLVLVCALLVNISPIKARADIVTGTIVGASVVSIPVGLVFAACAVILGVHYLSNDRVQMAVADFASDASTYIHDGTVEILQTVTDAGTHAYYVSGELLNTIRSWFFDSGTVAPAVGFRTYVYAGQTYGKYTADYDTVVFKYAQLKEYSTTHYSYSLSEVAICLTPDYQYVFGEKASSIVQKAGANHWYKSLSSKSGYVQKADLANFYTTTALGYHVVSPSATLATLFTTYLDSEYYISDVATLSKVPTLTVDGTSARTWAPAYANRGLYVVPGSGTGGNEGQNGRWFWPLFFGLSIGELLAMAQAQAWIEETSPEFDEYEEKQEYEVTPAPEFDGYPSIEIAPVPDPAPDPDPGTGTDPGGDSAETTWWQRFTQWFLDLRTAINELPNRFDEHFENLNNNVNEVPNKFESWIQGVQSSVDSVAESILGTAEEINAAIQSLPNTFMGHFSVIVDAIVAVPQAILSGLKTLFLSLFSPSADFMESKVTALKEKYPFVDTFSSLGVTFKSFFQNIGSKPPIIWIDLGAGSGWFPMGGRVKFLDLSWYSQFKPLMDNISGGFLWLWTGWRLFQSAPGIISGASGMFGQARTEHERSFRRKDSKEG